MGRQSLWDISETWGVCVFWLYLWGGLWDFSGGNLGFRISVYWLGGCLWKNSGALCCLGCFVSSICGSLFAIWERSLYTYLWRFNCRVWECVWERMHLWNWGLCVTEKSLCSSCGGLWRAVCEIYVLELSQKSPWGIHRLTWGLSCVRFFWKVIMRSFRL